MNKLVVFDIAGTTLEDFDVVGQAFEKSFNHYDLFPTKEQINKVMGMAKPEAIDLILKEIPNPNDFDVKEIHDEFLRNIVAHYKYGNGTVKEISGTSNIFRVLNERGFKVALDTGFNRETTNAICEKAGWWSNKLVDTVVSSDEVSAGRPFPYMIFKIMERLNIKSTQNVIKVGDTLSDIQEGQNAGCGVVIGVTSGTCSRNDFKNQSGAFHILPDVTYVPALLEAIKQNDIR